MKRTNQIFAACTIVAVAIAWAGCTKKNPLAQAKQDDSAAPRVNLATALSKPASDLRNELLSIGPTETLKLAATLEKYLGAPGKTIDIDSYPDADMKFYVAQLGVLRAMRSIVWRASGIFEKETLFGPDGFKSKQLGQRISHNSAYAAIRGVVAGLNTFLPRSPAQVAFRFVVEPSTEAKTAGRFAKVSDIQRDLYDKLAGDTRKGALHVLRETLEKLQTVVTDDAPIAWDNRLAFGADSYEGDDQGRFEAVGSLEIKALLAATHMAIHDVLVFNAFDYDLAPRYFDSVSKKFGLDGLFGEDIEGSPASEVLASLVSKDPTVSGPYASLFKRKSEGAAYLSAAYINHLVPAKDLVIAVYEGTKAGRTGISNDRAVFVKERLGVRWIPQTDTARDNLNALVSGPVTLKSPITKETASFHLPAFYLRPPDDLKALLPHDFADKEAKSLQAADGSADYRNYWWGRPTGWTSAVDLYVPGGSSEGGMERAGRVLAHSVMGGINNPLLAFVPSAGAQ